MRLRTFWSSLIFLLSPGTTRLLRLPPANDGWHPQRHHWAAGDGVWREARHLPGQPSSFQWGNGVCGVGLRTGRSHAQHLTCDQTKQQAWLSAACGMVKVPAGCHSKDPPRKKKNTQLNGNSNRPVLNVCITNTTGSKLQCKQRIWLFSNVPWPFVVGGGAAKCLQNRGCEPSIST